MALISARIKLLSTALITVASLSLSGCDDVNFDKLLGNDKECVISTEVKEIEWCKKVADKGDAKAQVILGYMFAEGQGVPKDEAMAFEWYQKAANQGVPEAQFKVGYIYLSGKGIQKDEVKAFEWFEKAAEQGNADAQLRLGGMYLNGEGGLQIDEDKSFAWLQKAAISGSAQAQFSLGTEYYFESSHDFGSGVSGVQTDKIKGREWFEKAFESFQKTAEQGDANAQSMIGAMYKHGWGVQENEIKAREWYQRAFESYQKTADLGDADAQHSLSRAYFSGDGVQLDELKAFDWLQKAAIQGHVGAQIDMARYYLGKIPKISSGTFEYKDKPIISTEKAIDWLQEAAKQGSRFPLSRLADIYLEGKGVPKDETKAFEYIEKLAVRGRARDQYKLGHMFAEGVGVPKNEVKAFHWIEKAAIRGALVAQFELGYLYSAGKGVTRDMIRSYAWYNLVSAQSKDFTIEAITTLGMFKDEEFIDYRKMVLKRRDYIESKLTPAQLAEGQRLASNWKKGDSFKAEANDATTNQSSAPATLIKQYYGTAFIVSEMGLALTNAHVTNDCKEVRITGQEGKVKVITRDSANDLALLQLPKASDESAALNAEPTKLRQGEDVVVFGFPLNYLLSSGGNLTPGTVSALSGLGNNASQIQITAPIQPGSSGSPVLDKKGNVTGIVMMMLDDVKTVHATGSVPQNVNFAVNGQTIRSFLDTNNVHYKTGGGFFSMEKSNADIADAARKWTVIVECWK